MLTWFRDWWVRPGRTGGVIRCVLLFFFVWLAGRFWHPYYGFTPFLQVDQLSETGLLPVLRGGPIYVHQETTGGYDGQYYAQLAVSPGLHDPDLSASIDNLPYRARRMLLSGIAWVIGRGEPVAAIEAYAWLNLVFWLLLAALLWRLFPTGNWRGTVAWAGVLFAAGTMQSVRFALTDLAALVLITGALWQMEQGKLNSGIGWLGLAALARETSVLSAVVLLPVRGASAKEWGRAIGRGLLVVLPLGAWLLYLKFTLGAPEAGARNFSWPGIEFLRKWREAWTGLATPADIWLTVGSLLAQLALTVQLIFILIRPQWSKAWWRLGAVYFALALILGEAVWEGFPGAAVRVLLPLTLAFNVLAVRGRVGAGWLMLGNLAVVSGVLALWFVPDNNRELAAQWTWNHRYLLETDRRWFGRETLKGKQWAWAQQDGRLTLRSWPHEEKLKVQLDLRGIEARDLEIRHAGVVVWKGQLARTQNWIQLPALATEGGNLVLELHSNARPQKEGPNADARGLGFVCFGYRLD